MDNLFDEHRYDRLETFLKYYGNVNSMIEKISHYPDSPPPHPVRWPLPARRISRDRSRPYTDALATLRAAKQKTLLPILQHLNGVCMGEAKLITKFQCKLLLKILRFLLNDYDRLIDLYTPLAALERVDECLDNIYQSLNGTKEGRDFRHYH